MKHNSMMQGARKQVLPILIAGLFFIIDRIFKSVAPASNIIGNQWIGWEYFENTGIAFSIPIPQFIIGIATPIILMLLLWFVSKHKESTPIWYGWWLLLFGALSNFSDRLLHDFVIDYFRINTGIINIADIMVLAGVIIIFFTTRKST